ncbi:hypothetical protein NP493_1104g03004 [Ridgeia piscesae]|uniref:COMM domain-containing protein n=1 Tax=Ridgeia piscesae TaxID=27915 RepID=A0AAD9KH37_RIDPI|nr:hypothetical protein NP493_1104g03004 [Ridgeia piscesae]
MAEISQEYYRHLNHLLKAPSKEIVIRLCNEAFLHRSTTHLPDLVVKHSAEILSIDLKESEQLLSALVHLVKKALFEGSTEPAEVIRLFPDDFHTNLRDLLTKIITQRLPDWKNHTVNNLVSLPRLVDFDWRVDIKTSSNVISRMSVPTCILQLQVQETADQVGQMPATSCVNVELSKETLDTMLDGLGKIRDQLSSVTK